MTAAAQRMRELGDSFDPMDSSAVSLGVSSQDLACALDLPAALPAELSIAEVAEVAGVSAHTLRYYERIGMVEVGRDASGYRVYDHHALARVVFLTRMRMSDMPIRTLQRYVELVAAGEQTAPARLALMHAHRAMILRRMRELRAALAVIDYKITTYGGDCAP